MMVSCETCTYYRPAKAGPSYPGACHRRAPRPFLELRQLVQEVIDLATEHLPGVWDTQAIELRLHESSMFPRAAWPLVWGSDGCGDGRVAGEHRRPRRRPVLKRRKARRAEA